MAPIRRNSQSCVFMDKKEQGMGKVTSISIQKGGTGKSTVTRNLGEQVSEKGRKVLLIDNDPQGNLTKSLIGDELPSDILKIVESVTSDNSKVSPGSSNAYWLYEKDEMPEPLKVADNLYLLGATKHLAEMSTRPVDVVYEFKDKIEVLAGEFDDIFIDCPPSAGTLQTAAHGGSDYVIIPTQLSEDSIDGVKEQVDSLSANKKRLNPKLKVLGILVNGKNSHKINIEEVHLDNLKEAYGDKVFKTVITYSVKVSEARSFNKTVGQHAPKSPQASQYVNFVGEYLKRSRG